MGLTVDMCHDIESYKEDVIVGFDWKKSIYIIVAAVIGVGTIFFFYKILGWSMFISVYASSPFPAVIVMSGFYAKNGRTFFQVLRRKIKKVNEKPLVYKSTECRKVYEAALLSNSPDLLLSEQEQTAKIRRQIKMLKFGLIFGAVLLVLAIVLVILMR